MTLPATFLSSGNQSWRLNSTEAIFVAIERSAEPCGKFDVAAAQTDIAEDAVVERHQLLDGAVQLAPSRDPGNPLLERPRERVAALARAVVPAAISAAPGLISAVRGRGKDAAVEYPATGDPAATGGMGAEDADGEEKWIGVAAGVAASVLPQVIGAIRRRRKDFAPEVMPPGPAGAGDDDDADAEQKWVAAVARAVVPGVIGAAPGLIEAVRGRGRGKDAAVLSPSQGNAEPEADEKWIGLAAGVAASVLPQVIGAIRRRKDFAPETAATGSEAGYGDAADAEQKWVAALARAVVPAAISAAPELINAV